MTKIAIYYFLFYLQKNLYNSILEEHVQCFSKFDLKVYNRNCHLNNWYYKQPKPVFISKLEQIF